MKKYFVLFLVCCFVGIACSKVPITGRKQLNLLPEGQLTSMSLTSYKQMLNQSQVVKSGKDLESVRRVGNNISKAVTQYLQQHKMGDRAKDFKWEYNLIKEDVVNAWAMPGGKVAVYTGLLPVAQDEAGLAVVMGHEVAHAIARHGNERMSQGLLQQLGGLGLAIALHDKPAETQTLFNTAYGVGSTVGLMLPFSRKHESEADAMGLVFMAMAGYDPAAAPGFWRRMSQASKGGAPPEFLSTHPAHSTRIANLNKLIPKAKKYYKNPQVIANMSGDSKSAPTTTAQKPVPANTPNQGGTQQGGNGNGTGTNSRGGTNTRGGTNALDAGNGTTTPTQGPKKGKVKVREYKKPK